MAPLLPDSQVLAFHQFEKLWRNSSAPGTWRSPSPSSPGQLCSALFSQVSDLDEVLVSGGAFPARLDGSHPGFGRGLLEARHGKYARGGFFMITNRDEAALPGLASRWRWRVPGYLVCIGITPPDRLPPLTATSSSAHDSSGNRYTADHTPAVGLFGVKMLGKTRSGKPPLVISSGEATCGMPACLWCEAMSFWIPWNSSSRLRSGPAGTESKAGTDWDTAARQAAWEKVVRAPIDTVLAEPLAQQVESPWCRLRQVLAGQTWGLGSGLSGEAAHEKRTKTRCA